MLDWVYVQPLTSECFNNKLLKYNKFNINSFTKDNLETIGYHYEKNIMSYVGALLINQNVGNTLMCYKENNDILDVSNIFELMYGLYSLHINNIVHGDICLTNLLFNKVKKDNNLVNVYILSNYGECDTYVFNNNDINFYIIDFGKAIVKAKYFKNDKSQIYYLKQQSRIRSLLNKYLPAIHTMNEDIIDEESNFLTLCLIDYMELSNCLKLLFKDNEFLIKMSSLVENLLKEPKKDNNVELQLFNNLFNKYQIYPLNLLH